MAVLLQTARFSGIALLVRAETRIPRCEEVARKLLDQVRHVARVKHLAYRTEKAYAYWVERTIRFHGNRHPNTMGTAEIEAFLTQLTVDGNGRMARSEVLRRACGTCLARGSVVALLDIASAGLAIYDSHGSQLILDLRILPVTKFRAMGSRASRPSEYLRACHPPAWRGGLADS